ncbi:MAG: acyltransferase [Deltaproteobacteria bacterium]|nr:MAG: acyltransferase [Deltaproteobacteria bacterium]
MRVALYQSNPVFGSVEQNVRDATQVLSNLDVDLVVLPELFNTGYQFISKEETASLAEKIPSGYTCRSMIELAKENKFYIVFGMAERAAGKVYNSGVLVGPSGFIGCYRKTHLFYEEKLFFNPGDTGFKVWDIGMASIGIMVCFDWLFPESARSLAIQGAHIIAHPANLVLPYCQYAMPVRCLENRAFCITANRVGTEQRGDKESLRFTGRSLIVDPSGKVLAEMDESTVGTTAVEIQPEMAEDKNITKYNHIFKDRKPDLYRLHDSRTSRR